MTRGLIVAVAPDLLYFEDTDGDGRADRRRVLYTGFGLTNIQQLVNSPQWALDNWVYACAGINPSEVRSVERPETPGVALRGRGIRFHPEKPGVFPPLPLMDGEKAVKAGITQEDMNQLTTWYTERAVKFIEQNKSRPFFLYVAHTMPHVPQVGWIRR